MYLSVFPQIVFRFSSFCTVLGQNYERDQSFKICLYYSSAFAITQCLIFLNNPVKHWPILIIFGTQHHKTRNLS